MEGKGKRNRKLIKRLESVGFGSEAKVYLEVRNFFPGIGWDIYTAQQLACANREDFNYSSKGGHRNFLRHAIIKKLEDFFVQQDSYRTAHIPRPLSSTGKGYIYEFVTGSECFPWEVTDHQNNRQKVVLDEWNSFVTTFSDAGINFLVDIADPDDARVSKNIILCHPYKLDYSKPSLSSLWAKIDFGTQSTVIDYGKLEKYLHENKDLLISSLSSQRYEFMLLALHYLKEGPKHMDKRDIGRLEILTGDFRISTISHINKRGFSSDFSKKCGIYRAKERLD